MDKTRPIGQKWLNNELDLHFLTLNKCTKGSGGLKTYEDLLKTGRG